MGTSGTWSGELPLVVVPYILSCLEHGYWLDVRIKAIAVTLGVVIYVCLRYGHRIAFF